MSDDMGSDGNGVPGVPNRDAALPTDAGCRNINTIG